MLGIGECVKPASSLLGKLKDTPDFLHSSRTLNINLLLLLLVRAYRAHGHSQCCRPAHLSSLHSAQRSTLIPLGT